MTMAIKLAGSAAAFAYPDTNWSSPADESAMFSGEDEAVSGRTWDQIIDELIDIASLCDDWDGEGSVAPDTSLVAGATKLALLLRDDGHPAADRVIASVNGTIYFEWYTSFGYQEIEVTSPFDAEARMVQKGSDLAEVVGITLRS